MSRASRLLSAFRRPEEERGGDLGERVRALEKQVAGLSRELADARRQGRRAAEIADLVTELLANEASRRDPEFVRILQRHVER